MNLIKIINSGLGIDLGDIVSNISTYDHILDTVKHDKIVKRERDVLPRCKVSPSIQTAGLGDYYKRVIYNYYENCMDKHCNKLDDHINKVISMIKPLEDKLKKVVHNNIRTVYTVVSYPVKHLAGFKFDCKVPVTYGLLSFLHVISYKLVYYLENLDDPIKEKTDSHALVPNKQPEISGDCRPQTSGRYSIFGSYIGQLRYSGISMITITNSSIVCEFFVDSIV